MTTFNYDLAADIAPYRAGLGPNYIIEPTLQAPQAVDLLKLHGSLNWATELPETDSFFRHLFALGSVGKSALRRLIVFNPDETVGARFRALLGPGALARYEFRSQTFGDAIVTLKGIFPRRERRPTHSSRR